MARLALILLLALSACSTAHGRAVDRARHARAVGDLHMETLAWREACAAKPSDHESCAAGEAAARAAVAQALSETRALCSQGKAASCLEALRPAHALLPNDPKLLAVVDEQLDRHQAGCGRADTMARALDRLACLESLPWDTVAWSRTLWDERRSVSREMDRLAAGSASPAATLAWASAASCLDGDNRQMTLTRALERIAIPVDVRVQMQGASVDLCPWIRHPGIVCGGARPVRVVAIRGRLESPRHSVREEIRQISYQTGVRRLPNPAYEAASQRLLLAEQALHSIQLEKELLEDSCSAAEKAWRDAEMCLECRSRREKDRLCDGARSAQRLHRDRERERDDARRELSRIAEFVEEPVVRDHRSRERLHTWEAGWNASLDGKRLDGRIRFEDTERRGFAAAGVEADPLEQPSRSDFERALASQLAPHVEVDLSNWLKGHSKRASCGGPVQWTDDWLGCWAELSVVEGSLPDGGALLRPVGLGCSAAR